MSSYFFKDIHLIHPINKLNKKTNIFIHQGKIIFDALEGDTQGVSNIKTILPQNGVYAFPGFLDIGTRAGEPGGEIRETFESVSQAALSAGYTSLVLSPLSKSVNDTPYLTTYIKEKTRQLNQNNFYLLGSPTKNGLGEELSEVGLLIEAGVRGFYIDDSSISNSYLMKKLLEYLKKFNVPLLTYCEDPYLSFNTAIHEGIYSNLLGLRGSPSAAEEIIVARDIALCRLTGTPIHFIKISTEGSLQLVKNAKKEGLPITASTSIAHLFLSEENLTNYDTNLKTTPPLRTLKDQKALSQALVDGTLDFVISDHNPLNVLEKIIEFDHALPGMSTLEYTPSLIWEWSKLNNCSAQRFAEIMYAAPSNLIFTSEEQKLNAAENLVIFSSEDQWTLQANQMISKSKNTPFIGKPLKGKTLMTFVKGQLKYENN